MQLDELVDGVVNRPDVDRMIHDLADHDGTNLRQRVRGSGGLRSLGNEVNGVIRGATNVGGTVGDAINLHHAVRVTPKGNTHFTRADAHALRVASQCTRNVAGIDPGLVAVGTEGKAETTGVKLRFVEGNEAARRNGRAVGDAVLLRRQDIIGDVPTTDVSNVGGGILEFNEVQLRKQG